MIHESLVSDNIMLPYVLFHKHLIDIHANRQLFLWLITGRTFFNNNEQIDSV